MAKDSDNVDNQRRTLGQRLMGALKKDYTYDVQKPNANPQPQVTTESMNAALNPREDAEINRAAGEQLFGKRKGGIVRSKVRGHGVERQGKTKGRIR